MCFRALQLYQLHDVESVFTHNQFLFENNLRLNFAVAAYVGLELQNMLVCAQENKHWGQDLVKGTINDGLSTGGALFSNSCRCVDLNGVHYMVLILFAL